MLIRVLGAMMAAWMLFSLPMPTRAVVSALVLLAALGQYLGILSTDALVINVVAGMLMALWIISLPLRTRWWVASLCVLAGWAGSGSCSRVS